MYDFKHLTSQVLKRNLRLRAEVLFYIREYFYKMGFLEINTPILSFPTKEYGDGEYTVSSRLHPGKYYSLPHSPQLYKQYLIAGMGKEDAKYFQLASNFRPEPGDATHIQEFQQLDFEIANADIEIIKKVISDVISIAFSKIGISVNFIELDYDDCIKHFGNDSPDLRYKGEIKIESKKRISLTFKKNDIVSKKRFKEIIFSSARLDISEKGNTFILQGTQEQVLLLGEIRKRLISNNVLKLSSDWSFVWLNNLPLFVVQKNKKLRSFHHPQMAPTDDKIGDLNQIKLRDLPKLRGAGCDLVVNGIEVAGGNIRNSSYIIQRQILQLTGNTKYDLETTYKPLLALLKHFPNYRSAGAAIGFDRLIMLLAGSRDIRESQPFPMRPDGSDFMGGPWPAAKS